MRGQTDYVEVALLGSKPLGKLIVRKHLQRGPAPELRGTRRVPTLVEGKRYEYEILLDDAVHEVAAVEPAELFEQGASSAATGVIATGLSVGVVSVAVSLKSGEVAQAELDVRAAKFEDEAAFASMLTDLARLSVESLHQGFSPSSGRYGSEGLASPTLTYQRFAVLHSLLRSGELSSALEYIAGRPCRTWVERTETRRPGQPIPGSSQLGQQLARGKRRVPARGTSFATMPAQIDVRRTDESLDNLPNRFVKSTLEEWRFLAEDVFRGASELQGKARSRGQMEAAWVRDYLDELLAAPYLVGVSPLRESVGDNFVLRRGEGYRAVTAAALLVDSSLGLQLDLEDPFLVSRRSIATLYEYWTFVRLAMAVAQAFNTPAPLEQLFQSDTGGMSLVLRTGRDNSVRFSADVLGVPVKAELFFNRTFGSRGSWTRQMRPDASLVVYDVRDVGADTGPATRDMWIHFDAKYKVDWEDSTPFETGSAADEEEAERIGASKRTDLLKMHAYKDAVHGSAGAFVLFPGNSDVRFSEDVSNSDSPIAEVLPGIGAFGLRPSDAEKDTSKLAAFVGEVIQHIALRGTRHRRATHWTAATYVGERSTAPLPDPPFGHQPPGDTSVTLGYVKNADHYRWITSSGHYNVRGGRKRRGAVVFDSNELQSELLVLYGPDLQPELWKRTGGWEIWTAADLADNGYGQPRGNVYWVCSAMPLEGHEWLRQVDVDGIARLFTDRPFGMPVSTTWLELMRRYAFREMEFNNTSIGSIPRPPSP